MEISDKKIKEIENKIRDIINWVAILNKEEIKIGEGKKIEDDTAKVLKKKLQQIAQLIGTN